MPVSASREANPAAPDPRPSGVLAGLRAAVARIEGAPQRFETGPAAGPGGATAAAVSLGSTAADRALGGGWPGAGLAELRGDGAGNVGVATGFALALAVLFKASPARPLLWIGTATAFREAGRPYGPGLRAAGLDPAAFLALAARRDADAVWAAEEAARSGAAGLVVLEVRGNPALLGLEGTRRLHFRAAAARAPLVLLRQDGRAEATAAPLRVLVAAGPSGPQADDPSARFVDPRPGVLVRVEKARGVSVPREIAIRWNVHERRFELPRPDTDAGRAFRFAVDRPDPAARTGVRLALRRAS